MPSPELPLIVTQLAERMMPIGLQELQAETALQTRTDHKYLVREDVLAELLAALADDHQILEIDARRSFRYRSVYFDSATLGAFRAHMQGRRRRYKCRTRHYVDSDLYVFEVKLKGRRGETVKHQLPCAADDYGRLSSQARRFADELLAEAYGTSLGDLHPCLETHYRRITLAAADGSARVTCDFGVRFGAAADGAPGLRDGYVIVETKSDRGLGRADRVLKALGVRPAQCSKYCIGVGLLRDDVKANSLQWLIRRYFSATPFPSTTGQLAHGS